MTLPYCKRMPFRNGHTTPDGPGNRNTDENVTVDDAFTSNPALNAGMPFIEKLLSSSIGLEPESIGRKSIAGAVSRCMSFSMTNDVDKYLLALETEPEELERLIEHVIVPETWFFRDNESFNYLKKYANDTRYSGLEKNMFKVLSVPCSTGEEPYSIAITLLETGFSPEQIQIDAIDINGNAIETAKKALYGKSAFRDEKKSYQDKYFTRSKDVFALDANVKGLVNFYKDNFVESGALWVHGPYQAVFCKNLLIYLTDDARKKVFENINRLLLPKGVVFTGHAEIISFLQQGYSPVKHARSFACVKTGPVVEDAFVLSGAGQGDKPRSYNRVSRIKCMQNASSRVARNDAFLGGLKETGMPAGHEGENERLAAIKALANRGSLDEAKSMCEQFLRKHKQNQEAYYLMGLICLALNMFDKAENFFQKTLYLDPCYYKALLHMKLLYEKKGDQAKASIIHERIKRIEDAI